jgi:hypothetical protein
MLVEVGCRALLSTVDILRLHSEGGYGPHPHFIDLVLIT